MRSSILHCATDGIADPGSFEIRKGAGTISRRVASRLVPRLLAPRISHRDRVRYHVACAERVLQLHSNHYNHTRPENNAAHPTTSTVTAVRCCDSIHLRPWRSSCSLVKIPFEL